MPLNRVRLILAGWVVCAVFAGWYQTVAYLSADGRDAALGATIAVWVVFWLLQWGLFMWVAQTNDLLTIGPAAFASMFTWFVDWTSFKNVWIIVGWTVLAVAFAVLLSRRVARRRGLRDDGILATATVLEVVDPRFWNVVVNNVYIKRTLRLRVQRRDGAPLYEVRYHGTFMLGEVPSAGDTFAVRVDPGRPQRVLLVDSAQEHVDAGGGGFSSALQQVAALHDAGKLTDAEFAAAKERILRG